MRSITNKSNHPATLVGTGRSGTETQHQQQPERRQRRVGAETALTKQEVPSGSKHSVTDHIGEREAGPDQSHRQRAKN